MAGDIDATRIECVSREIEWLPYRGRIARFPEAGRAEWFTLDGVQHKIVKGKAPFSIGWNKSRGRCYRSEKWLYPSSSG